MKFAECHFIPSSGDHLCAFGCELYRTLPTDARRTAGYHDDAVTPRSAVKTMAIDPSTYGSKLGHNMDVKITPTANPSRPIPANRTSVTGEECAASGYAAS